MHPKKLVFADVYHPMVLRAVQTVKNEGLAFPILIGNKRKIQRLCDKFSIVLEDVPVIDHLSTDEAKRRKEFAKMLHQRRQRKGLNLDEAKYLMNNSNYFGMMLVETGSADAFLSGFKTKYQDIIRPALHVFGSNNEDKHISGMYMVLTKKGPFFFADATVNINCDAASLVATTLLTADEIRKFNIEPKIAMLSFSNFGATRLGSPSIVRDAVSILHHDYPELIVDGEIQANFALNKELRARKFPFSKLQDHDVNTLIFPDLNSGNIAYKLMKEIGGADIIGPVLLGMNKSVHILQMESSESEIVDMAAIAVVDAQYNK